MAAPNQTAPIAVYGATGYTGRLVARELRRRGAEFVIAGRSRAKLDPLADELGGAETVAVSLDDPAGLQALLEPCAAVIACAGPFTLHGEPVVAAAVETGTHYIDTTGEQLFMKMVFDRYGSAAEQGVVALVPGMGFDYVPGDLLASLTAAGMGALDEIVLAYWTRGFGATRGTMLTSMEIMRGGDLEWRDGDWRPASQRVGRGSWSFPPPAGEQRMVRYPSGEQVTVPRHVETGSVRTLLSATTLVPRRLAPTLPVMMPALGLAMRTPLRRAAPALIGRLPEGPEEKDRRAARFLIACEARAGTKVRRGTVGGPDPYGLTATTTVHGALLAAEPSFDRSGALAPAQAFDPEAFLDALSDFGVSAEVDPLPEPAAVE